MAGRRVTLARKLTTMPTPISKPKRTNVRNSDTQSNRKPTATTNAVKNNARPVKARVVEKIS